MKTRLQQEILKAAAAAMAAGDLPETDLPQFVIERPKKAEHGDLAANLAMQLAKPCKMNPRAIAEILARRLGDGGGLVTKAEIAGPGFINFFLNQNAWLDVIPRVLAQGGDYGQGEPKPDKPVMVEFVSANPTGPLHVGHGRGAALGDTIARLLTFAGHQVKAEYYINDAGNQMNTLGRSVLIRARMAAGSGEEFPEKHYKGDYIGDLAAEFQATPEGAGLLDLPEDQAVSLAAKYAGGVILSGIKDDLKAFNVHFDNWYSEAGLVTRGAVQTGFDELAARGLLYEEEGALWFKATRFGDEKDRVVKRSNGETTYFASDIAYHLDKIKRGFGLLIDVWGADHHGYVPRVKAAMAGLGAEPEDLQVVLVQMVSLLRAGEPVAMSTRAGEFVTLKEVVDEVGADSARFLFLTRRSEAPLDFDLEAAKAQSMDNPVYYVQYAHTRVKSILRKATDEGVSVPDPAKTDLSRLSLPEELELARRLQEFPQAVQEAAASLEPHRLTYYLSELAGLFHSYYNAQRVMVADQALRDARLLLVVAVGQVIANCLTRVLGVSAPEAM